MTARNQWGRSLFKGRIGEAIVEVVLSEFGYRVLRSGQEFHRAQSAPGSNSKEIFAPDLAVTDPKTQTTKYVEVKLRSARPMSVIMESSRLDQLRRFYPGTILIFVSSYNGSVNCANVDQMTPANVTLKPDGFCEFDLLRSGWMPIWHFFPLVKPGERLRDLWTDLTAGLRSFGNAQVSQSKERELSDGEREALEEYIRSNWDPAMEVYLDAPLDIKECSLDQLWDAARRIGAFRFAVDLLDEECIGAIDFTYAFDRFLGERGEHRITIDRSALRKALEPYPDLLKRYDAITILMLHNAAPDAHFHPVQQEVSRIFREEFLPSIPRGVGKAYLMPERGTLDEALEIDIRTFIELHRKRNRLDAEG